MTIKKKKGEKEAESTIKTTQEAQAKPVVRQVVEIVEVVDEGGEQKDKQTFSSSTTVEEAIQSVAAPPSPPEQPVSPPPPVKEPEEGYQNTSYQQEDIPEEPVEEKAEEKKKAVADLFSREESQVMPEISVHVNKRSKKKLLLWSIGLLFAAVAIGGGLLWFSGSKNGAPPVTFLRPTSTPTPTQSPTPTPTPEAAKKSELTIQVLNGGGKSGAASKMKEFLQGKGYTVSNLGNTEEYSYEDTEIHSTASRSANLATLKSDLSDTYTVGTEAADLPADSSYDIRVIVGKK